MSDDPRDELLANLNYTKTRVEFSDSPIVLLCGGHVPPTQKSQEQVLIKSFRHAITLKHTSYEIFRPEEIDNWQEDGIFKNLMDFEAELASICSLVVVILESPGSIAELGAFSQLEDMSKKLVVVNSGRFDDAISFINLGILRYISEANSSSVKSYPWAFAEESSQLPTVPQEIVDDAIKDIGDELGKLKKSEVFKPRNNAHVTALVYELINLFIALKEIEIIEYLERFGIEIKREKLRSKLFLLQRFRLIKKTRYSDSKFYILNKSRFHGIRLALSTGKHIDRLRTTTSCAEYYNSASRETHRARAIKQAAAEVSE